MVRVSRTTSAAFAGVTTARAVVAQIPKHAITIQRLSSMTDHVPSTTSAVYAGATTVLVVDARIPQPAITTQRLSLKTVHAFWEERI